MCSFFLTLCERKDTNSPISLEIGKFQNITVLVPKPKFEGNNSHFLYFLGISNSEITLNTQEQKLCYTVLFVNPFGRCNVGGKVKFFFLKMVGETISGLSW